MENKNLNESGEIWKDIKGYERLYQVSNLGRIKSLKKKWERPNCNIENFKICVRKEKILKTYTNKKTGYVNVVLTKDKKQKFFLIHRLVAETFLSNPNNYKEVNHKNLIKTDNRVENLEWINRSENMKHAVKNNEEYLEKLRKHIRSLKPYSKKKGMIKNG